MTQRIQHRRDTTANWTSANPVLSPGEIGIELNGTTGAVVGVRVGDGTTAWNALDRYATMADVTAAIDVIVDGAPGLLDTLNELAAALGDDPNFIATMAEDLADLDARVRETKMAVIKNDYRHGDERGDVPAAYWLSKRQPLNAADHDLVNLDGNLLTGRDLWLKEATALWMADGHDGGGLLLDKASNRHHLQMGSTHVAAIAPAPDADAGLLLPGQTGRYAGVSAGFHNLSGYTTLTMGALFEVGNTSAIQQILNRQQQIGLGLPHSWIPRLTFTLDGTNYISVDSSVALNPIATKGLRFTRNATTGTVLFEVTTDGITWNRLSSVNGKPGILYSTPSVNKIDVGATNQGAAYPFKGFIYQAWVIGNGTPVFDADFTKQPHGTTSFQEDALGATVTINGTTGDDTNDPLFLGLEAGEDPYLYLPGVNGNYASTPDSAALDVVDLDLRVRAAVILGPQFLISKYLPGNLSFQFSLSGVAGHPTLQIAGDGSTGTSVSAGASPVVNTGQPIWLRVTRVASSGETKFFQSEDGDSWTQIGATQVLATGTTPFSGTGLLYVGYSGGSSYASGNFYRAQVYDGIDGTLVADFDPSRSREPHRNFVDSVGNLWTINRSTTGRKAALVDRPMFLLGTDDYMEAPDHADLDMSGDMTIVAAFRYHATAGIEPVILKRAGTANADVGWSLIQVYSKIETKVSDGTISSARLTPEILAGSTNVAAFVRNTAADTISSITNTIAGEGGDATTGTLTNAQPVHVGKIGGSYHDMEFIGAAIFQRALSDAEIEEISYEFGWSGPPESLLDEAVVATVAGVNDGQRLVDITGRGHNFTLGSTSGADTNDPTLLSYDGGKYAYLPGVAGNYISTPDSAALDITGDLDIRVRVAMDDWTPAGESVFAAKSDTNQRSWRFYLNASGSFGLSLSVDGVNEVSASNSVVNSLPGGAVKWVRATWRQSDGRYQTFLSDDGVTWTQLGVDATIAVASIAVTTTALTVGARGVTGAAVSTGKFYAAEVRNGIDGTVVASFNANAAVEPYATWTDPQGNVWTFNRSATGKKLAVVDQNMLLFGTDDHVETPDDDELDFGASDQFIALVLMRRYGSPDGVDTLLFKRTGTAPTDPQWGLFMSGVINGRLGDSVGQVSPNIGLGDPGVRHAVGVMADATHVRVVQNTLLGPGSVRPAGSSANNSPVRMGADSSFGGNVLDGEIMGVAIVRRALSAAELTQLANELIAANNNPGRYLLPKPVSQYLMEA